MFTTFHADLPAVPVERAFGPCARTAGVHLCSPPTFSSVLWSGSPHTSGPRPWPAQVTSCLRLPRIPHPWPRAPRASQIHPLDPHLSQFPEKPLGFRSRPRQSGLHCSHPTAGSPRLAVEQPPACLRLRGPRNSDRERAWKAAGAPELSQPSTLTLLAEPPPSSFPASCLSPH